MIRLMVEIIYSIGTSVNNMLGTQIAISLHLKQPSNDTTFQQVAGVLKALSLGPQRNASFREWQWELWVQDDSKLVDEQLNSDFYQNVWYV